MRLFLPAALLLAVAPLSAQTFWPDEGPRTWAPRPTEAAITANDLRTRLYQFADDSMMGREAGTLGAWKGTEYIAAEFKRLGLVPAGDNGTYFQEIPLGRLFFDTAKVALNAAGRKLKLGEEWVPSTPNANNMIAGSFSGNNVGVVFGGRMGDSTPLDPAAVRGKVVVMLAPAQQATGGGRVTGMAPDRRAADAGAAGVLIVQERLSAVALNPRNGMMPTVRSSTGGAAITPAVAATLFDRPLESLAVGTAGKAISGSWTYQFEKPQYPARNVLAVLPGSDPVLKNEYVVIGAHNDHVGMVSGNVRPEHDSLRAFNRVLRPQGANDRVALDAVTPEQWARINALIAEARKVRPPRIDSVNNGADDDGSGSMVLLEIAEYFASQPAPKRSILFNSHAGEEKGLLGSAYWVENPTVPLENVVAAHNMDMLGKGRVTDVRFGGPSAVQMLGSRRLSADFGDVIDSLNAVRSEPMVIDYSWDRTNHLNRFCRSDQVSYFRKEIPVTYFSLGYSIDYHQPTDEPQYINYDQSARVARFVHEIANTVANRLERLRVLPVDQRDLSARC